MEHNAESTASEDTAQALFTALAAADLKRLVRASSEEDTDEIERIRRRYLNG